MSINLSDWKNILREFHILARCKNLVDINLAETNDTDEVIEFLTENAAGSDFSKLHFNLKFRSQIGEFYHIL